MFIMGGGPAMDTPALDGSAYFAVQAAEFAAADARCARCGGAIARISDGEVGERARYLVHRPGMCRSEAIKA